MESAGESQSDQSFEIHLELFAGPLALLLHLIEKNNLNILDIPISHITHEYLEYLELMKSLEMEVAGEFLVMATTLMHIKTKMLLPRPEENAAQNDPRLELVNRLMLYQQFSKISRELEDKAKRMERYAFRPSPVFEREEYVIVQNIYDIFGAFKTVLENFKEAQGSSRAITIDPHPVEAKIEKILNMLKTRETLSLSDIFDGEPTKHALVACFLAMLELIKRGFLMALQQANCGEIVLARRNKEEETVQEQKNESGTQSQ